MTASDFVQSDLFIVIPTLVVVAFFSVINKLTDHQTSTGTFLRPSFISSRCPCKRKHSPPQLSLKNPHWRFSNRHLLGMCFYYCQASLNKSSQICCQLFALSSNTVFESTLVTHQSSLTSLSLFISLFALSLSRWLRALFSYVCFAPSFSFVSCSFPLLTGDSGWGGGGGLSPLARVASKTRCFSRKCFFMLSGCLSAIVSASGVCWTKAAFDGYTGSVWL